MIEQRIGTASYFWSRTLFSASSIRSAAMMVNPAIFCFGAFAFGKGAREIGDLREPVRRDMRCDSALVCGKRKMASKARYGDGNRKLLFSRSLFYRRRNAG